MASFMRVSVLIALLLCSTAAGAFDIQWIKLGMKLSRWENNCSIDRSWCVVDVRGLLGSPTSRVRVELDVEGRVIRTTLEWNSRDMLDAVVLKYGEPHRTAVVSATCKVEHPGQRITYTQPPCIGESLLTRNTALTWSSAAGDEMTINHDEAIFRYFDHGKQQTVETVRESSTLDIKRADFDTRKAEVDRRRNAEMKKLRDQQLSQF